MTYDMPVRKYSVCKYAYRTLLVIMNYENVHNSLDANKVEDGDDDDNDDVPDLVDNFEAVSTEVRGFNS